MDLDVLYLDNHLLVVNKPAGMLVQADRTGDQDLLSEGKLFLKHHFNKPGNVFLGLVHRLDRPVSGVVVFGRTSKAASRLSDQFRRRVPEKKYMAVVEGSLSGESQLIDHLLKDQDGVRLVPSDVPGAMRAVLRYRAVESHGGSTLLDVDLQTGRPHQVRIQLANAGHPIVGDMRYGAVRELDGRNLALHCYSMGVQHPTLRMWMHWQASPPATWGETYATAVAALLDAVAPHHSNGPDIDAGR